MFTLFLDAITDALPQPLASFFEGDQEDALIVVGTTKLATTNLFSFCARSPFASNHHYSMPTSALQKSNHADPKSKVRNILVESKMSINLLPHGMGGSIVPRRFSLDLLAAPSGHYSLVVDTQCLTFEFEAANDEDDYQPEIKV